MEAGRHFLASSSAFPSTTQLRHTLPPPTSVTSAPTTFITRHFPTSVLLQEQREEFKPLLHLFKEEKTSQAMLDRMQIENGASVEEDFHIDDFYKLVKDFRQLHVFSPLQASENSSASLALESNTIASDEHMDFEPCDVLTLAKKKALSASKEAALLADSSKSMGAGFTESLSRGLGWEEETVRSTRLLERRRKRLEKRNLLNSKILNHETSSSTSSDVRRKNSEGFNPNDPLRLFLWGPETRQLLTLKEETELIAPSSGNVFKLEAVKSRLQSQYGHEPTLVEWAEAVGISCQMLQSQLRSGTISREKLIYANLRMVVHIAKQYQGRGSWPSGFTAGGKQTIRKAIFQHSRTIRLPENVYTLLGKVLEAKKSYIQEGNHNPSKEELARRVGITVEKLGKLLYSTRMPVSMQQTVWADQDTTYQEITADTGIEDTRCECGKAADEGNIDHLTEIGEIFGLSKERVRQLESRAFLKLKQSLGSQGLGAYAPLLV
ncbi:hypothetical protein M0R45_029478 [Rubus argutus]|uniref:RNA polymerase sigma-70 domain-containing protein n=1 Tax=Rubus argutus TaxID=59490 RepID=A0AAW1WCB5_RUBAR